MALTRAEVERLLTLDPATSLAQGFLRACLRLKNPTPEQRALIDELSRDPSPRSKPAPDPVPGRQRHRPPEARPLSDSDRLWISRLPAGPEISGDDADVLATLEAATEDPSDLRLIRSILTPVRDRFERDHKRQQLTAAKDIPAPWVPSADVNGTAVRALADTIRSEAPDQSEHAALADAQHAVMAIRSEKTSTHSESVLAATEGLAALGGAS